MAPEQSIARLICPHTDMNEDYPMARLMMLFMVVGVLALQGCAQGARQNFLAPDLNHVLTNGKVASIHSEYSAKRVYQKLQRYFSIIDRQYAVRNVVVSREPYGFRMWSTLCTRVYSTNTLGSRTRQKVRPGRRFAYTKSNSASGREPGTSRNGCPPTTPEPVTVATHGRGYPGSDHANSLTFQ